MKNSQLIKENKIAGGYTKVYPLAYIQGIYDSRTGEELIKLLKSINHIYLPYNGTSKETRESLPSDYRRKGIIITYKVDDELITEVYIGNDKDAEDDNLFTADVNWEIVPDLEFIQNNASKIPNGAIIPEHLSPALWELLSKDHIITNFPDEEDLTQHCKVLKFKDRNTSAGKGYKILRKNWVGSFNILEATEVSLANTIYEIRYDFDLNGKEITLPKNATLLFNGGTFNNGKVICVNTNLLGINKFKDAGNAEFSGTFLKGLILNIEDTIKWYDGNKWVSIRSGNDGSNGEGGITNLTARVIEVKTTENATAEANVVDNEIQFKFGIPKGEKGDKGDPGTGGTGEGSGTSVTTQTFTIFISTGDSLERPATPTGGHWNSVDNVFTPPRYWSRNDELGGYVWMSSGIFRADTGQLSGTWSTPFRVTGLEGSDGSDGTNTEFIFRLSNVELSAPDDTPPNNPLVSDYIPTLWDDHPKGVSKDMPYEYVCTRNKNSLTGQWDNWEGPALWSKWGADGKDGDGVEYVYTLTSKDKRPYTPDGINASEDSPTTNYQDREFIPAQVNANGDGNEYPWTDNPSDVDISTPYEWVSIRRFKWSTQTWGAFEEPTLWAKYGKDGDEAVAAFKSIVFRRTNSTLTEEDTPRGGNYANPIPDEPTDTYGNPLWTDGIPDGGEVVWMSSRIFSATGGYPQQEEWSVPSKLTDTASFDVEFSSKENPGLPTGHPNTNPDWSNTSDSTTLWMATSTMNNGVWSPWTMVRIKGEKGEAGTSIQILGSFDSYEALVSAWQQSTLPGNNPPQVGDCYLVNGTLYIWDGDSWFDGGGIKGTPGKGIKTITNRYAVHTSATSAPDPKSDVWKTTSPATDNVNKYLWKETTIVYTNVEDEATDDTTFYELIGVHGDKGIDGDTIEYIFCLTKTDEAPQVPSSSNPINTNSTKGQWSDDAFGPDKTWKYEWVSSHIKTWDESKQTMVWGPYSEATHWAVYSEDGKGVDSIIAEYAVHSKGSDSQEVLGNLTWSSGSPTVTYEKPFLWKRTKIRFTDGDLSDAWSYEMIGKLGDKGIDGESVEYIFKMTTTSDAPATPTNINQENLEKNIPGQWTDDPLTMMVYNGVDYRYQWVSQRTKKDGVWDNYSKPSLWSELYPGLYIHIKYSNGQDNLGNWIFTSNNGEDVGKYIGVLSDYNRGDSNNSEDYTWRKFQGDDGFGREYIFILGNDYNNPPNVPSRVSNDNVPQYQPSGWSLDPIIPTPELKYCWCCHRDYRDNVWGDWSGNSNDTSKAYLFSMYAESVKGETGVNGPILFPAGYWESNKLYEQLTKTVDGKEVVNATPYVYDNTEGSEGYYYLIAKQVQSNIPPSQDPVNWEKMSTFNAIYTDILLANNAKVGQAVFNGDYMFSQNGINPQTGARGEYKNFNLKGSPYTSSSTFDPNWCVNLVTGEQWIGAGNIHFDADGNATFGENKINVDGTGQIANGDIKWNGSVITVGEASGFECSLKITNEGLEIVDSDYIWSNDPGFNQQLPSGVNKVILASDRVSIISAAGISGYGNESLVLDSTGITKRSVTRTPVIPGGGGGEIVVTTNKWPSDESSGGGSSSGGGNIEFVEEIPSNPKEGVLYVFI